MRISIQIPDDLYDRFLSQAEKIGGGGKSVSPEELILDRLQRFQSVEAGDRVIVVDNGTRARLEKLLSGGSLLDSADLLRKVEGLATVQIGEIKLDFTPAEVRQLHRWSKHGGRPLPQLLQETVDRIKMGIFDYVRD